MQELSFFIGPPRFGLRGDRQERPLPAARAISPDGLRRQSIPDSRASLAEISACGNVKVSSRSIRRDPRASRHGQGGIGSPRIIRESVPRFQTQGSGFCPGARAGVPGHAAPGRARDGLRPRWLLIPWRDRAANVLVRFDATGYNYYCWGKRPTAAWKRGSAAAWIPEKEGKCPNVIMASWLCA